MVGRRCLADVAGLAALSPGPGGGCARLATDRPGVGEKPRSLVPRTARALRRNCCLDDAAGFADHGYRRAAFALWCPVGRCFYRDRATIPENPQLRFCTEGGRSRPDA